MSPTTFLILSTVPSNCRNTQWGFAATLDQCLTFSPPQELELWAMPKTTRARTGESGGTLPHAQEQQPQSVTEVRCSMVWFQKIS